MANFEFKKDNLKIASGTLKEIAGVEGGVRFNMTNGTGRNNDVIGSFTVTNKGTDYGEIDPRNVVIRANNTYYRFATEKSPNLVKAGVAVKVKDAAFSNP